MNFFYTCLAIWLIVAIPSSIYDIMKFRIPLYYVLAGIAVLLGYYFYNSGFVFSPFIRKSLTGACVSAVVLLLARFFTAGGLGYGDIIFGGFTGLFVSNLMLCFVVLGVSAVCGLIFYLIVSFTKKQKDSQGNVIIRHRFAIPYIPFMTFGTLLTIFILLIN